MVIFSRGDKNFRGRGWNLLIYFALQYLQLLLYPPILSASLNFLTSVFLKLQSKPEKKVKVGSSAVSSSYIWWQFVVPWKL